MKQLLMKLNIDDFEKHTLIGEGISIKTYDESKREDLKNALLAINENRIMTDEELNECIVKADGVYCDGIFLAYLDGHVVGTTTGILKENFGTVHMVSVSKEASGKKLGKILCEYAVYYLKNCNCKFINLTTDDFRKPAIKTYLDLGFLPVLWDSDMIERWQNVAKEMNINSLYGFENQDCTLAKVKIV